MSIVTRRDLLKLGAADASRLERAEPPRRRRGKRTPHVESYLSAFPWLLPPHFFPKKQGDLSTSDYLRDGKVTGKMTVFENFFHPGMGTSNHDSEKSLPDGVANPEASNFVNSVSLDQVLARQMGTDTRFPFLNFSIYDRGWGCSWNDRGVAIPPMHDEEQIFNMLFGKEDLQAKKRQLNSDKEILACLHRDLAQLDSANANARKARDLQKGDPRVGSSDRS